MSDLKPCPFCGKDPNQTTAELGDRPCFYYECGNPKCGAAEMGWHNTEQEARDAWNTRPIEDALRKEIAQLQADNRSLVDQMNAMALKPNQEVIEWHDYPEELPERPMCKTLQRLADWVTLLISYERGGNCFVKTEKYYWNWFSGQEGFDLTYMVTNIKWAYLPKGSKT